MTETFRLHAVGGLCNRLRAILSYRAVHRKLVVVWEPDQYVSHGRFEDVFEPLEGVTFVDSAWFMKEDFAPHPNAPRGWETAYGELLPVGGGWRHSGWRPYCAIHVRRTDHVPDVDTHGGRMTPIGAFLEWAFQWPGLPVWCAVDNGETRATLERALGSRFRAGEDPGGAEFQQLTDHRRNGSLQSAVTDMFQCAVAAHFMGSHASSFTDTIEILRRLRG